MAGIRNMGLVNLAIVALVVSSVWAVSMAQSSGSGSSCTNALVSMAPCLNYITGNSSTPTSNCCSQLQSVVKSSPQCLCQVINGGSSSVAGVNINQTQAMTLPSACKVQTPPASRCSSGASPSGSPAGATPTDSTTPQGGSKATPTSEGGSSDASRIMSKSAVVVPLFLALSVIVGFSAL